MNNEIFFTIYNFAHRSEFLDKSIVFFANIFPYLVILGALFFLVFYYEIFSQKNYIENIKKNIKNISLVFVSGVTSWFVATILKNLFQTKRPFLELSNVISLFKESGYAFPSGHATFFMAIAVMIFFINKKAGYFFILFAVIIGLARVASGVHFPIDILGGILLGTFISMIFNLIFKGKKN